MIHKLLTSLYADDNVLYFNEDSGDFIFSFNEIGILSIDLNNINLDDTNKDETETVIDVRLLAWHSKFEKRKTPKKRVKQSVNACSMVSYKMVEFLHVRR